MSDASGDAGQTVPSFPLRVLFAIWLLSITAYGFFRGWTQLSHFTPRTAGYDYRLAIYWLIAAALLAVVLIPLRTRPHVIAVIGVAYFVVVMTMVVRSGELKGTAVGVIVLLAAYALGSAMLYGSPSNPSGQSIRFAAGLGGLVLAAVLIAAVHLLRRAVLWPILVILASFGAFCLARFLVAHRPSTRWLARSYESSLLLALAGLLALANFTWVVSPELKFDALNYHLPVAKAWAAAGRIVELPWNVHAYNGGMAETAFAVALVLSGQTAVKIIVFTVSLLSAAAVGLIASRVAGAPAGIRAAVLFLTVPLIGWESSTADVELFLCLFLCNAVLALLEWGASTRGVAVAGLLTGSALATKVLALMALPVIALWALWMMRRDGTPVRTAATRTVYFCALAVIFAAPWYAVRYHFTGNPVFPYYTHLFPTHRPVLEWENHVVDGFRLSPTPANVMRLPWLVTFDTSRFSESGLMSVGAGTMLLVLLPWCFRLVADPDRRVRWLLALALSTYLIWSLVFSYARFYTPVLPWVVIGGVLVLSRYANGRLLAAVVSAVVILTVVLQGFVLPAVYWEVFERLPYARAFGQESREALIDRSQRAWAAAQYVNAHTDPGEVVVSRGLERVRFYVQPEIRTWQWDAPLHSEIDSRSDASIARSLRQMGIRYVILDDWTPSENEPYARPSFLRSETTQVFDENHLAIYRLLEGARPGV